MTQYVIYRGSGDWSALYIDGKLERVGDHYLIDEKLQELFGVQTVSSDDFMRGQDEAAFVAQTIDEVVTYHTARKNRQEEAARLREEAATLTERAFDIERSLGR